MISASSFFPKARLIGFSISLLGSLALFVIPVRAQGEAIAIRDVSFSARGFVMQAQNVEISGSSLPRAAIEAALRSGDAGTLPQRLESLGASAITFTDFRLQSTARNPSRTVTFGRLVINGLNAGRIRSIQGSNGTWRTGQGESTIASLSASGVSGNLLLQLMGDAASATDEVEPLVGAATFERVESNPSSGIRLSIQKIALNDVRVSGSPDRRLPDALGAMEWSDVRFLLPPRAPNATPTEARIRSIVIGADRLTTDDLPTRYRLRIDNLSVPLSPDDRTPAIQNLRGLGLEELSLTAALEGNYSQRSRELKLDRLGISAAKLGSLAFSGVLGNVAPEVFTAAPGTAGGPWGNALVRSLGVVIRNDGLYERATERFAKARSRPVEEVRRLVSSQAIEALKQAMSQTQDQAVLNALSRFLANPKSFSLTIAPKPGATVPFSAIITKGGMQTISGQYDVTARAE